MKLLGTRTVEKPWGKPSLPPQFDIPAGKRIGEVWFEPPSEMPDILVKYIFTSEKLSVQVHPTDEQARRLGEANHGKEECWLVIDAEPGATLGIGFKEMVSAEAMRTAACNGSIEDLMQWFKVKRGDFFYIPAGTVHAIGAGVSLVEIQQNSDITYRLYDYGRPRELHLDSGISVAMGQPYVGGTHYDLSSCSAQRMVDGPYFKADLVCGQPDGSLPQTSPRMLIPLNGDILIGTERVFPGQAALLLEETDILAHADALSIIVSMN